MGLRRVAEWRLGLEGAVGGSGGTGGTGGCGELSRDLSLSTEVLEELLDGEKNSPAVVVGFFRALPRARRTPLLDLSFGERSTSVSSPSPASELGHSIARTSRFRCFPFALSTDFDLLEDLAGEFPRLGVSILLTVRFR